jgi:hypothetical protein
MESTLLPENRRAIPWHWIVLGLLVVVHAGVGAITNPRNTVHSETVFSFSMGLILSHSILFAFWAAFAPQRFYHRFLWSLLVCILVAYTVDCGALFHTTSQSGALMLADLILFMLETFILLCVRLYFGWQITIPKAEIIYSEYQAHQFGIKHLILLITIAAVGFGLLRSLFLINPSHTISPLEFSLSIIIGLVMYIPVIMLTGLILTPLQKPIFPIILLLICFGVIDLAIKLIGNLFSQPYKYGFLDIEGILFLQLGAALSVLITTLVMRWCGFRMIRVRKAAAAPVGTP